MNCDVVYLQQAQVSKQLAVKIRLSEQETSMPDTKK